MRENNLNLHDLGVQACHIQLFSSLDVYLKAQFSAVVADKLSNYQLKDHKIKLLVQFGVQDCKGVTPLKFCRPSTTHLPRHLQNEMVSNYILLPLNTIYVKKDV